MNQMSDALTKAVLPPENQIAEAAVLGSILRNNTAFDSVAELVRADQFYYPQLGEMFRICAEEIKAGRPATPVLLRDKFKASDPTGDTDVAKLVADCLVAADMLMVKENARMIADCWLRRQLQQFGASLTAGAVSPEKSPDDIMAEASSQLDALGRQSDVARPMKSAAEAAGEMFAQTEESWKAGTPLSGIETGFPSIDLRVRGLRYGRLYVIAARPGMGKSALALSIAVRTAKKAGRGLFWSGEMSADELASRAIAAKCRLPIDTVITGMSEFNGVYLPVSSAVMDSIHKAHREFGAIPLWIDDREGITVAALLSRARQMKRSKDGLAFVIVDYLGLMRGSDRVRRSGNRVSEISEISSDLVCMARELNVPVIALSQLNRQSENREDRRPVISDLRDSGAIEQDARCVMAIYREEQALQARMSNGVLVRHMGEKDKDYNERAREHDAALAASIGKAELIVLKNRGGKTGIIEMQFDGPSAWFRDVGDEPHCPAW